jgi:prepilin-type N-terminal cleavage/methylation domain-containing protein
MTRSYQKGFTLIEVIVIIIIVGLLGAFAIPKYISFAKAAEHGSVDSVIGALKSALNLHSARQILSNQPITAYNPFDDASVANYVGAFGDVDLNNCPPGSWAYQAGDSGLNGNWAVVCYRPNSTLTQAFSWGGVQWIILVESPVQDANGVTVGLSLDYYLPVPIW